MPKVYSLSQAFLEEAKLKSFLIPGNSPDLNPIEPLFSLLKRKLEKQPTRILKELRRQVRKLWNNLSNEYLYKLCTSMKRMRAVKRITDY